MASVKLVMMNKQFGPHQNSYINCYKIQNLLYPHLCMANNSLRCIGKSTFLFLMHILIEFEQKLLFKFQFNVKSL